MMYELKPTNWRKSFGWKAIVYEEWDIIKLRSYDTIVAEVDLKLDKAFVNGRYSTTTAIHINTFLDKYGYESMSKEDMQSAWHSLYVKFATKKFTS